MAHASPYLPREEQWIDDPGHGPIGSPISPASPTQQLVFQWVDVPREPQYPPAPAIPPLSYSPPLYQQQQQQSPASPMAPPQQRSGFDSSNHGWGGQYDVGLQQDSAVDPWWNPHGCAGAHANAYAGHRTDQPAAAAMRQQKGGGGAIGQHSQGGYGGGGGGQQAYDGKGQQRRPRQNENVAQQVKTQPAASRRGAPGAGGGGAANTMDAGRGGTRQAAVPNASDADAPLSSVLKAMGPGAVREALVETLESIYKDRIKPMASYVKGRLKEKQVHEAIVKSFIDVYTQHPDLFNVQRPNMDDATIFLVNEPQWFQGWIDIDSADDPYDEGMWSAFASFLEGVHAFAGGRYGMARDLLQRNLPFLAPYSLGEICHIVQLAIQHRKLIVYHRKMLKPIQTIMCQQPSTNSGGSDDEIKDMDHLCLVLFRMLLRHPEGVQLSRLKQTIKHEFGSTISEIAFLCTKLSDLFNREPLAGTFKFDTEDGGKSMYVRLGNPGTFTEHVNRIFANASAAEGR